MMRVHFLMAAALALAAPFSAAAQGSGSVECAYAEIQKTPLPPRTLGKDEEWTPAPEVIARLPAALEACSTRHSWPTSKREPAAMYAIAQSGLAETGPLLGPYGLNVAVVQEYYGKIGFDGVAAILAGKQTEQEQIEQYNFIAARDSKIATFNNDELYAMGIIFGRALAAFYLMEKARTDFAKPPAQ